jgi:hypothetical protein
MDIDIESERGCAGFMLEVDPDTRPDIFQVASVAFRLAGRENSIKNFDVRLHCLKLVVIYLTSCYDKKKTRGIDKM